VYFLGSHLGGGQLIADLLETASGMSDEDILLRLKGCTPRELTQYKSELLRRREDLRIGSGHRYSSFIDTQGRTHLEYEVLVRLTDLVAMAISRKRFEKPTENIPPAVMKNIERMPNEAVAHVSTEQEATATNVPDEAEETGEGVSISQPSPAQRLPRSITSKGAAKRLEEYLTRNHIGQTEFAIKAGITDRTLRTFRNTGKVRRGTFDAIAKAMGTTREDLLKPE